MRGLLACSCWQGRAARRRRWCCSGRWRPTRGAAYVELAGVPFFAQQDYQCGPASLAAILRYSGVDVDAETLRPRVYLPGKQGSLAVEMAAAARSYGRIAFPLPPDLAAVLAQPQAGRPVVVLQNLGLARYPLWHFAVVIGYDSRTGTVILRSGTRWRVEAHATSFVRTWTLADRWALVVVAPGQLPASCDADRYSRAVAATKPSIPRLTLPAPTQAPSRAGPSTRSRASAFPTPSGARETSRAPSICTWICSHAPPGTLPR